MTESQKKWIDDASYEDLLRKWRFAPSGDLFFQGDTGEYYSKVMKEKQSKLEPGEASSASKNIGW